MPVNGAMTGMTTTVLAHKQIPLDPKSGLTEWYAVATSIVFPVNVAYPFGDSPPRHSDLFTLDFAFAWVNNSPFIRAEDLSRDTKAMIRVSPMGKKTLTTAP